MNIINCCALIGVVILKCVLLKEWIVYVVLAVSMILLVCTGIPYVQRFKNVTGTT